MQTTRSISITATLVLAVFAVSGCSFLVTSGPDSTTVKQTCVTSKAPVVIDVAMAIAAGTMSLVAFSDAGSGGDEADLMPVIGAGFLIPTALSIGSAAYGNWRTNQCESARRRETMR